MTGTSPTLGWHQLNVITSLALHSTLVLWWIDDCVALCSTEHYYTGIHHPLECWDVFETAWSIRRDTDFTL